MSADPMAEKYYPLSPYGYCAGNPISVIDPLGLDKYRNDKETGEFILMESTNDPTDQVLCYHINKDSGEYKKEYTK